MKLLLLILVLSICSLAMRAQSAPPQNDNDFQSWNDLQLSFPLDKYFDLFTKFTFRFGRDSTRLTDARQAIGIVWKPIKTLQISPFYWYVNARNSAGVFKVENRFSLAATYRYPFKKFGLTHRSTVELRERSGVDSWRYRAMMMVDKDLPKKIIPRAKWFASDEIFYDSTTGRFSRNRFSVGITKTLSKQVSVDIYYTRQNDGFSHPGDLNILWAAWKVHF